MENEHTMNVRLPLAGLLVAALVSAALAGCGSATDATSTSSRGACPVDPISVVVTVDQWGDIVDQLGGDCARVTTIIKGSAANPHDYEPTPGDSAKFEGAQLVVLNGLDYDPWANKAIETLSAKPAVIDGGKVVRLKDGDNPHIWYGPEFVRRVAAAVTAGLKKLAPKAASYFDEQHIVWQTSMKPYDEEIAKIRAVATGTTYGASEPVFDYLADAVGMTRTTPQGYQNSALNDADPSPADVAEFEQSLRNDKITVFVYNTQTEGPTPAQIRGVAEAARVPVVEVTETVPPGTDSFVMWQVKQLESLARALGT